MLNSDQLQVLLKQKGISQRDLVKRSGLSESVVSTLIKQMPVLLPHLIEALGQNPYASDTTSRGEEMADILNNLSKLPQRSISNPALWQKHVREERALPGRE